MPLYSVLPRFLEWSVASWLLVFKEEKDSQVVPGMEGPSGENEIKHLGLFS